jgi:phenylacetate-CoA ligase
VRRGGLRVAFFLRSNSNLYQQTHGTLIDLRYFDIMLPLEQILAQLKTFQPQLIIGPPLMLALLAQEKEAGRLPVSPQRLISVAEVLEPQDRQSLENVFQAPVHQVYQCTEGLLAVSCPAGSLHVQEDLVVIQYEPLAGDPQRLTPIVTDLWRTTQPILRYRLNDVLQLESQPCRCGSSFQVIRAIEGRCDDICYFESCDATTTAPRPFFPDTVRRMILLAGAGIEDYQAVQEQCGALRIHLLVSSRTSFDEACRAVQESILSTLAQYDCRPGPITFEPQLAPIPPGAKRRRVQRQWQPS